MSCVHILSGWITEAKQDGFHYSDKEIKILNFFTHFNLISKHPINIYQLYQFASEQFYFISQNPI